MYLFLLKVISLIGHPLLFLKEHALVAFSRIHIKKSNTLNLDYSIIRKSHIHIDGKNNLVDIKHADIFNSTIHIFGNECTLCINDSVRLYNVGITIKKAEGGRIEIGKDTHLGGGTIVCAGNRNIISIGESCMIAEDVEIWNSDTHIITFQGKDTTNARPIIIGNHVWLGKGVTVLKGVIIGENAVVGMKSVVTHDLRACTINAGVPAQEIQEGINWHK